MMREKPEIAKYASAGLTHYSEMIVYLLNKACVRLGENVGQNRSRGCIDYRPTFWFATVYKLRQICCDRSRKTKPRLFNVSKTKLMRSKARYRI
ncbi:hypothetical protein V512_011225 [Mesotoga sp. Brook.08.105.5.1]|nr:hypothetical protein V512_011225 [Mesotoga sp. Brook.08.105.5.1]